jgi:hypothetical protein
MAHGKEGKEHQDHKPHSPAHQACLNAELDALWLTWTDPQRAAYMNQGAPIGTGSLTADEINKYGSGGSASSNWTMADFQAIDPAIQEAKQKCSTVA